MNSEMLIAKGRISDLRVQRDELETKADSYLIMIREILDPYSGIDKLELNRALTLLKDFRELQLKWRETDSLIKKIESDLGL